MKHLFLIACFVLTSFLAKAQLSYENGVLTYGGSNSLTQPYNTAWKGSTHYWIDTTWIAFNLTNNNPRIVSKTGETSFMSNGGAYQDICIQHAYCYSDARAKTNVSALNNSTAKILKLNPVSYEFKHNSSITSERKSTNREMGFLAQELQQVLPEAVMTDGEGRMLVNYTTIIPVLTQSIQELNALVEELTVRIQKLESE